MVTGGGHAWSEHSITDKEVESLCHIPEMNVTLCIS